MQKDKEKLEKYFMDLRKLAKVERIIGDIKNISTQEEIFNLFMNVKKDFKTYKTKYIVVSIVLYSLVALAALICIISIAHPAASKRAKKKSKSPKGRIEIENDDSRPEMESERSPAEENLRCPLCGWKYKPGEKVCKNCRTQF